MPEHSAHSEELQPYELNICSEETKLTGSHFWRAHYKFCLTQLGLLGQHTFGGWLHFCNIIPVCQKWAQHEAYLERCWVFASSYIFFFPQRILSNLLFSLKKKLCFFNFLRRGWLFGSLNIFTTVCGVLAWKIKAHFFFCVFILKCILKKCPSKLLCMCKPVWELQRYLMEVWLPGTASVADQMNQITSFLRRLWGYHTS